MLAALLGGRACVCPTTPPPAFTAPPFFCGRLLCHLSLARTVSGDPAARVGGCFPGALRSPPLYEEHHTCAGWPRGARVWCSNPALPSRAAGGSRPSCWMRTGHSGSPWASPWSLLRGGSWSPGHPRRTLPGHFPLCPGPGHAAFVSGPPCPPASGGVWSWGPWRRWRLSAPYFEVAVGGQGPTITAPVLARLCRETCVCIQPCVPGNPAVQAERDSWSPRGEKPSLVPSPCSAHTLVCRPFVTVSPNYTILCLPSVSSQGPG